MDASMAIRLQEVQACCQKLLWERHIDRRIELTFLGTGKERRVYLGVIFNIILSTKVAVN